MLPEKLYRLYVMKWGAGMARVPVEVPA